ncbi:MAG TPA: hypothetical protein VFC41_00990 [Anaerovoracaceae bacterium]|nr:hypothetical protein [Anaerovoracaceae bacterium]
MDTAKILKWKDMHIERRYAPIVLKEEEATPHQVISSIEQKLRSKSTFKVILP